MIKGVKFKGNEPESVSKLNIIVLLCAAGAPPSSKVCAKAPLICKNSLCSCFFFFERWYVSAARQYIHRLPFPESVLFKRRFPNIGEESSRSQPFVMSQRVRVSLPRSLSGPVRLATPPQHAQGATLRRFQQESQGFFCFVFVFFPLNLTETRLSKLGASAAQALTPAGRETRHPSSPRRVFCLKSGDEYDKKDRLFVIKGK